MGFCALGWLSPSVVVVDVLVVELVDEVPGTEALAVQAVRTMHEPRTNAPPRAMRIHAEAVSEKHEVMSQKLAAPRSRLAAVKMGT
jgi:hypothetical protein